MKFPAIRTGEKIVIVLLFLIIVPVGISWLQYNSYEAAEKSIINPSLNIDLTGPINDTAKLIEFLENKELTLEFDVKLDGKGSLPITISSIKTYVYLEGIYLGSIESNESKKIPTHGVETAHMIIMIDQDHFDDSDWRQIAASINEHNGELDVTAEIIMEPIIIAFPITMITHASNYINIHGNGPKLESLSWSRASSMVGEETLFTCNLTNLFRYTNITGSLGVSILEELVNGSSITVDYYTIPVNLQPGESMNFTGEFVPYKSDLTKGFILRVEWNEEVMTLQEESYPPSLQVIEGTLEIMDVYWTRDEVIVSRSTVNELIQLHLKIRALNASLNDNIIITIRDPLEPDYDVLIQYYQIELEYGEEKELVTNFNPSEPSKYGYYVEIRGDTIWNMPEGSPPRLIVDPAPGLLMVENVWWSKNGNPVTSAYLGDTIFAHVIVKAMGGPFDGNLGIYIKSDIVSGVNEILENQSYWISVIENEERELSIPLTVPEVSSDNFNGYYIEVDGGVNWEMNSTYPPRLSVIEDPRGGYPLVMDVWWTVSDASIYVANVGDEVTAIVHILSAAGDSAGTLNIHVWRDLWGLSDEIENTESYIIDLEEGESVDLDITFMAIDQSGFIFRGYYIQVELISWNDNWTMIELYPPRLGVS